MSQFHLGEKHGSGRRRSGSYVFAAACIGFACFFVGTFALSLWHLKQRRVSKVGEYHPEKSGLQSQVAQFPYDVKKVTDGDTLVLSDGAGVEFKVRLEGIDAPEISQPFGDNAKEMLQSIVSPGSVRLVSNTTDKYGRHLGTVYCQKGLVNLLLVRSGFAWVYGGTGQQNEFSEAQASARKERIGLWASSNPVAPWDWRSGLR